METLRLTTNSLDQENENIPYEWWDVRSLCTCHVPELTMYVNGVWIRERKFMKCYAQDSSTYSLYFT